MSDKVTSWRFVEDYPSESDAILGARERSEELGVEPVSPAVGSYLAMIAAAVRAQSICELGTGTGVSGLWLLSGAPHATLTTIDVEISHHEAARLAFADAQVPSKQTRLIAQRAGDVIEKLADASYDVVFIDADPLAIDDYVLGALRIARQGGAIIVNHALWGDKVADPVQRDDETTTYRNLLADVAASDDIIASLSATDDGVLTLIKK